MPNSCKNKETQDPQPGFRLMSESGLLDEVARESARSKRNRTTGFLALLQLDEPSQTPEDRPASAGSEIVEQILNLIEASALPFERAARDARGRFLLLLPTSNETRVRKRLEALSRAVAEHTFEAGGESQRFTPSIGYAPGVGGRAPAESLSRAELALANAVSQMDLRPAACSAALTSSAKKPRTGWAGISSIAQALLTLLAGIVLPFFVYVLLGGVGVDISGPTYVTVVVALSLTAAMIWWEARLAVRRKDPPELPEDAYPPASAIIAAYLPNESATIIETVEAFLRLEYPARLQVILAYNTPERLPVEEKLREIARRDPRFVPLHVQTSASKAQNINAAVAQVTGEFAGVFDADHQPDPGSFQRAWRWLASGCDVVQGHCVVRNGDASWVARMAAVEFETMYALCHPGRERLHGFGLFGGSNGYWRTSLLRQTRMHSSMLTEDIDSSMRVLVEGRRIASDPFLISRELAPTTLKALWNQRMRWAQGWFQVSLAHAGAGLCSRRLSLRQKLGIVHLLIWRELFPWLSLQVIPILAYWNMWQHRQLDWFLPILLFTTTFTLSAGPMQALLTYHLADSRIRKHKSWFLFFFLASFLFYSEFKNTIARVAQLKEITGERTWKITPRTAAAEA